MRTLARLLAAVAVGLAAAAVGAAPALAHGGEDGLVVEPSAAPAGTTVVVRGDLPTTSPVQLVLVSSRAEPLVLATVADPTDGHFETVVTLPPGAAPGTSRLEARSGGALLAGRDLGILPAAAAADEGGRADQAEPVAASTAGSAAAIRPDAAALRAPVEAASRPWPGAVWPALGGAVVVGVLAVLVASAARRRRAGVA